MVSKRHKTGKNCVEIVFSSFFKRKCTMEHEETSLENKPGVMKFPEKIRLDIKTSVKKCHFSLWLLLILSFLREIPPNIKIGTYNYIS